MDFELKKFLLLNNVYMKELSLCIARHDDRTFNHTLSLLQNEDFNLYQKIITDKVFIDSAKNAVKHPARDYASLLSLTGDLARSGVMVAAGAILVVSGNYLDQNCVQNAPIENPSAGSGPECLQDHPARMCHYSGVAAIATGAFSLIAAVPYRIINCFQADNNRAKAQIILHNLEGRRFELAKAVRPLQFASYGTQEPDMV